MKPSDERSYSGEIINAISKLQPGHGVVYHTGQSGWVAEYPDLMAWFDGAADKYHFLQRKIAGGADVCPPGVYEYIAVRASGSGSQKKR